MNPKHNRNLSLFILTILITLKYIPTYFCQNEQYQTCRQPFQCANLRDIRYPFWAGNNRPVSCGYPGFNLNCEGETATLSISSILYRVLEINNTTQTLRIARQDLWNTYCPALLYNTTLNYTLFDFSSNSNDQNVTLFYGCSISQPQPIPTLNPYQLSCDVNQTRISGFYLTGNVSDSGTGIGCTSRVSVPVNEFAARDLSNVATASLIVLQNALASGFWIDWAANNRNCENCVDSGGVCGYNQDTASFACYCADRSHEFTCSNNTQTGNDGSKRGLSVLQKYLIIGFTFGIVAIVILSTVCYLKRRHLKIGRSPQSNKVVENFLLEHGSLAPKRYNYDEIKKITKYFKEKLGRGGYGSVYKGTLPDGRLVAVKILTETNSTNGEEFINEVASISTTSHVNIVNLFGFCFHKNKRALVYEFMPNKSLDKYICTSNTDCNLDLEKLYNIALGVARGLEYLHRGCSTRIVHFDIKPQNILLDEDYCPKISDFGLARLCKKKQSVLSSMTGTRGTIGYIAPEVFSRSFGGVSHKSDVYSYGMMVLEMAGERKITEIEVTLSSENNFPDKIYKKVVLDEANKLDKSMNEVEEETARKMFLVGFWCIQTTPSDRPSMSKVVEMLEGSLESIQIPPKPSLFTTNELSGNGLCSVFSLDEETKYSTQN